MNWLASTLRLSSRCIPVVRQKLVSLRGPHSLLVSRSFASQQQQQEPPPSPPPSSDNDPNPPEPHKRRLDIAIVGLPNAGKSQLLNMLTGSTHAAVSRKRHTTRNAILGTRTLSKTNTKGQTTITQLCFIDTPGFLKSKAARKEGLKRDLQIGAKRQMQHVDFTLLVIDAAANLTDTVQDNATELMLEAFNSGGRMNDDAIKSVKKKNQAGQQPEPLYLQKKLAVVLNKVDRVHPKTKLLDMAQNVLGPLAEQLLRMGLATAKETSIVSDADDATTSTTDKRTHEDDGGWDDEEAVAAQEAAITEQFPIFFYTNALREDKGVNDVLEFLQQRATPTTNFEILHDSVEEMDAQQRAQEIIREKLYRCLHREVPYNLRQRTLAFSYSAAHEALVMHHDIICHTKSHQALVLGTGDRTLKKIQETAARDIEKALNVRVILTLQVKLVRSANKKWSV